MGTHSSLSSVHDTEWYAHLEELPRSEVTCRDNEGGGPVAPKGGADLRGSVSELDPVVRLCLQMVNPHRVCSDHKQHTIFTLRNISIISFAPKLGGCSLQ